MVIVNDCNIKIWWNWVPQKGIGPFVEQSPGSYRIIKRLNSSGKVVFHILNKERLEKEKAQELNNDAWTYKI